VLPLPHWEKRKSLLIRRLAAREVRSRAPLRCGPRVGCILCKGQRCCRGFACRSSRSNSELPWDSRQLSSELHLSGPAHWCPSTAARSLPTHQLHPHSTAQGATTDERAGKPAWMLAGDAGGVSQQRAVELQSPPPAPETNGTAEPQVLLAALAAERKKHCAADALWQ
jgi:hypothetical protein